MNGREPYSEELLSAYLDGELTSEERQLVERELESSPQYQRKLQTLRALSNQLQNLERYQLGGDVSARIADALEDSGAEALTWSAQGTSGELLSAYMDGELSSEERSLVEQQLAQHKPQQQLLDEFRSLQAKLADLPSYRLDDGFAGRVLQQIAAGATDAAGIADVTPAAVSAPRGRAARLHRNRVVWTAISIAAALLLMFVLIPRGQREEIGVAHLDTLPSITPRTPEARVAVDVPPAPMPPAAADPQWMLVSSIGRNAKQKLVLVYEVSATEEGVDQAAFSNLLRRHRIGFNKTVAVGPEEQKDLLKHRFLDDVQVVEQEGEMDRVHLFLVTTTGRTADAIYMDLMNRPPGIASFFLNLTTREAHDRILQRLCEASKVEDGMGQAVRLAANLGMFSRTARSLGAFGAIRWVEPALLETPQPPPAGTNAEQGPAGGAVVHRPDPAAEDFGCELLFVVRELRSRSTDHGLE